MFGISKIRVVLLRRRSPSGKAGPWKAFAEQSSADGVKRGVNILAGRGLSKEQSAKDAVLAHFGKLVGEVEFDVRGFDDLA